jgi:hypothetical protein
MVLFGRARLATALAAMVLSGLGATAATAVAETVPPAPTESTLPVETGHTATITVREVAGKLRFVGPTTVAEGDTLEVVNRTNPLKVGPITFSLVRPGYLPKTKHAQAICFTPGHICWSIAEWQGVHGEGLPTINPAEAGEPGWDTMGTKTTPGDSWFSGTKRGTSFAQEVTARAGTRLWFMDAIHPWLRGTVKVVAPN